jgi:hypothetical protein
MARVFELLTIEIAAVYHYHALDVITSTASPADHLGSYTFKVARHVCVCVWVGVCVCVRVCVCVWDNHV